MREHHVCGLHCLNPYCAWHVDGGGPDQRVRSSALAGRGGRWGCSLCQPGALAWAGRSRERGARRDQPGLFAAFVLRWLVDAYRGAAALAAVGGTLPALVLVFPHGVAIAWIQQQFPICGVGFTCGLYDTISAGRGFHLPPP